MKTLLNLKYFPVAYLLLFIPLSGFYSPLFGQSAANSSQDDKTGKLLTWKSGFGQSYGLYLPSTPEGIKPPVVVYLHGFSEQPLSSKHWIIDKLNKVEPCAVLIPSRPNGEKDESAWGGTYNAALRPAILDVLAELNKVIALYPVDGDRQYLFGVSMGGEAVYSLLISYPSRFAGAVSVSGYTLNRSPGLLAKTALWLICGSGDTINCGEAGTVSGSVKAIFKAIKDAGGARVKITEYPGADHNQSIRLASREDALYAWLLGQRRF